MRVERGELDQAPILQSLTEQRYQLVLLTEPVTNPVESALTAEMRTALETNYLRWSETDYAVLYRPVSILAPPAVVD